MAAIVVPFRGSGAKLRLAPLRPPARTELALAMLADVLSAVTAVGATTVVTDDQAAATLARELGAAPVQDPGGGQGQAVAAALAGLPAGTTLVVNADLPCATAHDLHTLLRATPAGGLAYVPAGDGTTNALSLSRPELFAPVYGPGSAERFRVRAAELGATALAVSLPNLADDVDTMEDLRRLGFRVGPRTQTAIATLGIAA